MDWEDFGLSTGMVRLPRAEMGETQRRSLGKPGAVRNSVWDASCFQIPLTHP